LASRVFLTAEWRDLAVLSFPIEAGVLAPHLPYGLELDLWEGQALVSLVGFQFLDTRVLGVPAWPYRNFTEVNLRFYVRRLANDGVRRGVVFIKEIVPYGVVAWLARTLYNENYVSLPMRTAVEPGRAEYRWTRRGADNWIGVRTSGQPSFPVAGSIDEFIIEHQWGYSATRSGECLEYRVERPQWRTFPVTSHDMAVDSQVYGAKFAAALAAEPISVILAEGSGVSVSFGEKITGRSSSD
jgi:uncharacterized protein YqjF (DUF2071 family)